MDSYGPVPGDPEIHLGQKAHQRDELLKSLHPDQPTSGGDVRPLAGRWCLVLDPTGPVVGQEVGEVDERRVDPPAPVFIERVPRGEDQRVEFAETPADRVGLPPDLRRPPRLDHAPGTSGFVARLLVVLPEQVHRADEPVLVRRHDPDRLPAHLQDAGTADERDVVKMNDVDVERIKRRAEFLGLEEGATGHLGGQRREDSERTFERVNVQTGRRVIGAEWVVAPDRVEGINAVKDVDLVPPAAERPRQAVDVSGVATKAMSAEERGDHAELHRRPPVATAHT